MYGTAAVGARVRSRTVGTGWLNSAEGGRWYASRSAESKIRYGEPIRRCTAADARGAATEAAWMPVLSRIRESHGGLSYASNCAGLWPRSRKTKRSAKETMKTPAAGANPLLGRNTKMKGNV